jgi:hypothetical protein
MMSFYPAAALINIFLKLKIYSMSPHMYSMSNSPTGVQSSIWKLGEGETEGLYDGEIEGL